MDEAANNSTGVTDGDLVRRYVNGSFGWLERRGLNRWPGTPPEEMWAGDRDAQGWRAWHLIPSTVTDAELDALQAEHGLPYPPAYRAFLKYSHFVELETFGFDFEVHLPVEWAGALRNLYYRAFLPERIIRAGLLPFGAERLADAGLVCFDTRRADVRGDSPVVIWDHDWVDTDKEIVPMYSSARKLFEAQLFYVDSNMDMLQWEDQPTDANRQLVEDFLGVDASGLGSSGRRWIASFYPRLVPTR